MYAGENDFLKPYGLELLESCVDPVVIHHPKGHTIPRFGTFSYSISIPFFLQSSQLNQNNIRKSHPHEIVTLNISVQNCCFRVIVAYTDLIDRI